MATNFDVKKGYTFKQTGQFVNEKTNEPVSLVNYEMSGEIRKGQLVIPLEVTITNPAQGEFRIRLGEDVTSALAATDYTFIVRMEDPEGDSTPFIEGNMKVLP